MSTREARSQLLTQRKRRLMNVGSPCSSDADSDVLADYVLALIRSDAPDDEIRKTSVENLEDFLRESALNISFAPRFFSLLTQTRHRFLRERAVQLFWSEASSSCHPSDPAPAASPELSSSYSHNPAGSQCPDWTEIGSQQPEADL